MAIQILPYYYEVPTSIGSLRFLRVKSDRTLSEIASSGLGTVTSEDIGGLSIEASMLVARNSARVNMGSTTYKNYTIGEGFSTKQPIFEITDTALYGAHTGADTIIGILDSDMLVFTDPYQRIGYLSGMNVQISLPCIVETSDGRYFVVALWIAWNGMSLDDYGYVNTNCSFVLPSQSTPGYFVGNTSAFFVGTSTYRFFQIPDNAADRLLNSLQSSVDIENWILGLTPAGPPDPYEPGGYSGTGGGGGGQNFASTPIGRAPLPTLSFADTGFCRIYNPTLAQLQALANYMWTDDNFLQTLINHAKQLLEDPIEAIISLSLVPVPVPNGTAQEVKVLFIPTGVSMPPVANQFVEVDCGTLSLPVEDQYGAALDFNPYTKIDLYLPYIGQVSIDVDEVMYKTMHCVYRVDVVTGMCVAIISVGTGTDETVLYQFAGHCGVQMPLNSADFSGWVGAIVTAAKTIGGLAAAGAGGAGPAAALIGGPSPSTSKTTRTTQGGGYSFQSSQTGRNPSTGRQITLGTESRARTNLPEVVTTTHETTPASFGELAARGTANTVDAIIGSKMHFEHAGSFSGNSGYIAGVRRPYAILKRPRQCYPENYASYRGFPAMIYMNLGDCTGYTEVHDIHLTGISATNPELGELAQLLKTGVIL